MMQPQSRGPRDGSCLPNGPGAAAILAAGVGSLALGVLGVAGDGAPTLGPFLSLWPPSGPLSGVTTGAITVWLAAWFFLDRLWRRRDVDLALVNAAAFLMLGAGLLLTFPPVIDVLTGG